jgi:hypothetical protein
VRTSGARVFLLSPARLDGVRASQLLRPGASFDLARRLRSSEGAAIGEVFAFLSALYFRGKLAYASRFARAPRRGSGVRVIVAGRGLVVPDERVRRDDLLEIAAHPVEAGDAAYRGPLLRDARRLASALGPGGRAVLLGSIATGRYLDVLSEALGPRLLFPSVFVGRGDMSRGGLMLRASRSGTELDYEPAVGTRRGRRPPRLGPPERA